MERQEAYTDSKVTEQEERLRQKRMGEKAMLTCMIEIYCKGMHGRQGRVLCTECEELLRYSCRKIEGCPFMESKTFCSSCSVHCYKPSRREQIQQVMKYTGPRMLLVHPVPALRHVMNTAAVRIKNRKREQK